MLIGYTIVREFYEYNGNIIEVVTSGARIELYINQELVDDTIQKTVEGKLPQGETVTYFIPTMSVDEIKLEPFSVINEEQSIHIKLNSILVLIASTYITLYGGDMRSVLFLILIPLIVLGRAFFTPPEEPAGEGYYIIDRIGKGTLYYHFHLYDSKGKKIIFMIPFKYDFVASRFHEGETVYLWKNGVITKL